MKIELGKRFKRKLDKIHKKDPQLVKRIDKRLSLLQESPRHPSLRLHKLTGFQEPVWSISITGDIRVLLIFVEDGVLLVDIGGHKEVYG